MIAAIDINNMGPSDLRSDGPKKKQMYYTECGIFLFPYLYN